MKPWDKSYEECKKQSMAEVEEHLKPKEPESVFFYWNDRCK
jgi:hypothetical protein